MLCRPFCAGKKLQCYNGSMTTKADIARISDERLLNEVKRAAADERHATAQLIGLLGELDARRLYLGVGCSSLFTYCTQVLQLSEHAAYGRIEAARASRSYPIILDLLADGALTLTAVGLLRSHLTSQNHREVLEAARHRSKREVEELIARLRPQPAVPASVRKLPCAAQPVARPADGLQSIPESKTAKAPGLVGPPAAVVSAERKASMVRPLAPERYRIQFTVSAETHAKLRQVQDLMRHDVPDGDPAEIFERALTRLLEHLQRTKLGLTGRPRSSAESASASRHIPAAVKREVWSRDHGRCAFVGTRGRCTETGFLEFHHVQPYAAGGGATSQNIQLRCRMHNVYEAELCFGMGEPPMVRESQGAYITPGDSGQTELSASYHISACCGLGGGR